VARALIIGCGCRGRVLGERLLAAAWAVRGTSRREEGLVAIEASGIEAAVAEPDRVGTVLDHVGDVAVVFHLLGSAVGEPGSLADIHGPRLERLLEKLVDTPVRGVVYEAHGSVDAAVLAAGAELVRAAGDTWRIRFEVVASASDDYAQWSLEMTDLALGLLSSGR
jgi:nucleoside-diphosphate-sugar epimerase